MCTSSYNSSRILVRVNVKLPFQPDFQHYPSDVWCCHQTLKAALYPESIVRLWPSPYGRHCSTLSETSLPCLLFSGLLQGPLVTDQEWFPDSRLLMPRYVMEAGFRTCPPTKNCLGRKKIRQIRGVLGVCIGWNGFLDEVGDGINIKLLKKLAKPSEVHWNGLEWTKSPSSKT